MSMVDELGVFPEQCWGRYTICSNNVRDAINNSKTMCAILKRMKLHFIKSTQGEQKCVFEYSLNSAKPEFDKLDSFFFDFYNAHIEGMDGDAKKKFMTKLNESGQVVVLQYPEIDSVTFLKNCYDLYNLSLSMQCELSLGLLAYNSDTLASFGLNNQQSVGEMRDTVAKLRNFHPDNFDPKSASKDNLIKVILQLTNFEIATKRHVESLVDKLRSDIIVYDSIFPYPDLKKCILQSPPTQPGQPSALDFLEFVKSYLLSPETTVICAHMSVWGLTTPVEVRQSIQSLLDKQKEIRYVVDAPGEDSIFTSTCRFIETDPTLREHIRNAIYENTKKSSDPCKIKSISFFKDVVLSQDPSKRILENIFLHMVVYACFRTMNAPPNALKPNMWGIQGTNLMILFMNEFTIRFVNNVLVSFIQHCQRHDINQLMLMDKPASTFFTLAEQIKKSILGLKVMKKTKNEVKYETFTTTLCNDLMQMQMSIASKNKEAIQFIEGLTQLEPQQSRQSIPKTTLDEIHDFNFYLKIWRRCNEMIKKLEKKVQTIVLGRSEDDGINDDDRELKKEECNALLFSLISNARAYKKGDYIDGVYKPFKFGPEELAELNVCSDPSNELLKQSNYEHMKRITRASYGLAELWPFIDTIQHKSLLEKDGVKRLVKEAAANEKKIIDQCMNDGGKFAEYDLMKHMTKEELKETCEFNPKFLKAISGEVASNPQEQDASNQQYVPSAAAVMDPEQAYVDKFNKPLSSDKPSLRERVSKFFGFRGGKNKTKRFTMSKSNTKTSSMRSMRSMPKHKSKLKFKTIRKNKTRKQIRKP